MLNRQKTILYFLGLAGGQVAPISVVKWAFLLREETGSKGGDAYYEFLPYKYGPYSFCIAQEVNALAEQGYVEIVEDNAHTVWKQTVSGKNMSRTVPAAVAQDAREIHWRYGRMGTDALLNDIYPRYRWYTVNSQRQKLADKPSVEPAIYTAGYEGVTVDGFLNSLMRAGIRRIIDVRHHPVSRRYGFHKTTLNRLANHVDMEYVHVPELGVRSEDRRALVSQADYEALFASYREGTLKAEVEAIGRVTQCVREKPSVLVCMESNPEQCHRSHLAAAVASQSGLPIKHLRTL